MLYVHENVPSYKKLKSVKCPKCNYNRALSVPEWVNVRTLRNSAHLSDNQNEIVLIKCKRCKHQIGIST